MVGALLVLGAAACESGWSMAGVTTKKVGVVFQASPPPQENSGQHRPPEADDPHFKFSNTHLQNKELKETE